MNAIITQYKKAILLALVVVAGSVNSAVFAAKCGPCAAAAAVRQSIKDAHAAAIAAGKPASREMELDMFDTDDMVMIEACCSDCAEKGIYCDGENSARCRACQAALLKDSIAQEVAMLRAPREELIDPCNLCPTSCSDSCDLNCKLQVLYNCCVNTNQQVRCQGEKAKKYAKKIRRDIDDVEDLVEDLNLSIADIFVLLTSVFDCTCGID